MISSQNTYRSCNKEYNIRKVHKACNGLYDSFYDGPVIVIVGPTGSGKTGIAIEIAKEIGKKFGLPKDEPGGEIISADSRAIYKHMDIGTAKPTKKEQEAVPHFGIDLVEPGERFTVFDFKSYAEQKISEIQARGHVPMIVGGTGLYIDALIYDYQFRGKTGEKVKNGSLTEVTSEQINCSDRQEMVPGYVIFGIKWPAEELRNRLRKRVNKLFNEKLYAETRFLVSHYGWDSQAMKSNIYQFAWRYLEGKCTLDEAEELSLYDDWHLAKRQLTWFKRNDKIIWLPLDKIKSAVLKYI